MKASGVSLLPNVKHHRNLRQVYMRRAVRQLLKDLGPTPHQVADTLADYGITGRVFDSSECAIARYVSAVVGADPRVSDIWVSRRILRIRRRGWPFVTWVRTTWAVSGFIESFDDGAYPLLMEWRPATSSGPQKDTQSSS